MGAVSPKIYFLFYSGKDCLQDWEKNLKMGDADLDTSAKSECAKARFRIGFLALHNFQYDLALEMFEQAEEDEKAEIGRSYPMAMWGAAMATMQILWQYSDCEKGKEFLKRIPEERDWITDKEKAYIETGYALYPNDLDCGDDVQFHREKRFKDAMEKVVKKYPKETEASMFFAVASLAVSAQSKNTNTKVMKNIGNHLQSLEKRLPTHSGLLHYITHFYDTPKFYKMGNRRFLEKMIQPIDQKNHAASVGLRAARNYLKVATSSCHGLHMPSHVFMRFGSWKESLQSNYLSIKVNL